MDGHCNGFSGVGCWRDFEWLDIYATRVGGFADHTFATDQNRHDDAVFRCGCYTGKRFGVSRIDDRCCDRGKTPRFDSTHDLTKTPLFVVEANGGQEDFRASHLFSWGNHFGCTRNNDFAILVHALGIKYHLTFCGVLLFCCDFDGDAIAHSHRPPEAQVLTEVDCAWSWKNGSEDRRDECTTPHTVADHLAETTAHRIFRIDVRRIDVPGHDGKQCDVLLGKRALELGNLANLDFIKGAVLDKLHWTPMFGHNRDKYLAHWLVRPK